MSALAVLAALFVSLSDVKRRRWPKGTPRGGQFRPEPRAQATPPAARPRGAGLAPVGGHLDGQKATGSLDGYRPVDRTWMDIPEDERERLLQETDDYLAELTKKVGQPSAKHVERAKRLLESLH